MELASLVTAIGVCVAFLLGFMLCKYETKGVIQRLTYQNEILLECLMNRVGFTPKTPAPTSISGRSPVSPAIVASLSSLIKRDKTTTITNTGPIMLPDDLPNAPVENTATMRADHTKAALPDLFQRRQAAFELDKQIGNLKM